MDSDMLKRKAAHAALELLPRSGILGLGTGSTVRWFIEAVGRLVRDGRDFKAVATSTVSRQLAEQEGIPLLDDQGLWHVDLCVDGADEVSSALDLIKGGGGAHTREKIVNHAAAKNVIIVDESKLSARLGEQCRLPVEVLAFGLLTTERALARFGSPALRGNGTPFITDSGNVVIDLATGPLDEPGRLEVELKAVPGVVETGLFINRADIVIVAGAEGIRQLRRRS